MFVLGRPFQLSFMIVLKAEGYRSEIPFRCFILRILALPTYIRHGQKGLLSSNTLDYYEVSQNIKKKVLKHLGPFYYAASFVIRKKNVFKKLAPGANVIKHFTAVSNEFL